MALDQDTWEEVAKARQRLLQTEDELLFLIKKRCPNHKPIQHRDKKVPWCNECKRTKYGILIGERA